MQLQTLDPLEGTMTLSCTANIRTYRRSVALFGAFLLAATIPAVAQTDNNAPPAPSMTESLPPNMQFQPSQVLGADDLVQLMVPYCPELSRSFRVSSEGMLELPLLKKRIEVTGLQPAQVEKRIAAELTAEQILNDPIVTVSVLEYRSRPVSVVGAVKAPLVFQETGHMTLLDAVARAGGFATNAGSTLTVTSHQQSPDGTMHVSVKSIPLQGLLENSGSDLNVPLQGGEEIRVPEAGHIFVAGNVKKPGSYVMQDNSDTTVIKALALSEGLNPYTMKEAYIYRLSTSGGPREEIMVPLSQILHRKSPDIALKADDILYIPENGSKKMTAKVMEQIAGFGATAGSGMLIYR